MRYLFLFCFLISCFTINAQCYPDRHNTTWYDAWTSCEASPNPNPARGESHWIQYDLGHFYKLKSSKFWNANQPDSLQNGLQNVLIDYSLDGVNWTEWGTFSIAQGTGLNTYEGSDGPDFDEMVARYFLITAIDNHGGPCYGFSEVKIDVEPFVVSTTEVPPANFEVFPNPVNSVLHVLLPENNLNTVYFDLLDASGKQVTSFTANVVSNKISIPVQQLPSGTYFLSSQKGPIQGTVSFVKQ